MIKKMDELWIENVVNKARQRMVNKDEKIEMLKYLKKMKKTKNLINTMDGNVKFQKCVMKIG